MSSPHNSKFLFFKRKIFFTVKPASKLSESGLAAALQPAPHPDFPKRLPWSRGERCSALLSVLGWIVIESQFCALLKYPVYRVA